MPTMHGSLGADGGLDNIGDYSLLSPWVAPSLSTPIPRRPGNTVLQSCSRKFGIIHPLRSTSKEEGGYHDLLRYSLIHMESYSTEHYERGGAVA